jgi:hypothetical protein
MARYDYGLRGPDETSQPRFRGGRYGADFDRRGRAPTPRVTAPYNMDYIRPTGESHPVNWARFGGSYGDQIGDERAYRLPYMTRGGTRTSRGSVPPNRYDYRQYGPDYGGRYPDEI